MLLPDSTPTILVLDDERAQLATLRAQLSGIGRVRAFADPEEAFVFASSHSLDAAIVDIRMPDRPTDGFAFIARIRESDHALAIIVRTADACVEIADEALKLHAFRRLVKSHTSIDEVQRVTREAIAETRARRTAEIDARDGGRAKEELFCARGAIDDYLTIGHACRVLLNSLRDLTTSSAGCAEALFARASELKDPQLLTTAALNRNVAHRLVAQTRDFLENPLFEQNGQRQASLNATLAYLERLVASEPSLASQRKTLAVTRLPSDLRVAMSAQALVKALRHVISFCFQHAPASHAIQVRAAIAAHPRDELALAAAGERALVFNRQFLPPDACAQITLTADLGAVSLAEIHRVILHPGVDLETSSLFVFAFTLTDDRHMFLVRTLPDRLTAFEIYIALVP